MSAADSPTGIGEVGSVAIAASHNGRRLTLDDLMPDTDPLTVKPRRVENSLPAGFRVGWLSGESESQKIEFDLTAGAGCGSPYMILEVKVDGDTREEVIDMREVVKVWIDKIVADGPTPKPAVDNG